MAAQANTSLYFCVVAPELNAKGRPWDKELGHTLPDIFVCLGEPDPETGAVKKWNCDKNWSKNCKDTKLCQSRLNEVPINTELKIGVFDNDDFQKNKVDKIYEPVNMPNAGDCTAGPSIRCQYWSRRDPNLPPPDEAPIARFRASEFPCGSCLAERSVENWYIKLDTCFKNPYLPACYAIKVEGEVAYQELKELYELSEKDWFGLKLECRIGYLERLALYYKVFGQTSQHATPVMDEIERLYRLKRGVYRDPVLVSNASERIYWEVAEVLRGLWDKYNLDADKLPLKSMGLTPRELQVIPDLLLKRLYEQEKTEVKNYARNPITLYVSENAKKPQNAYFCNDCIDGERQEKGGKYEIVVVKPKFRELGFLEQSFALIEEAYHAHQHDMTVTYLNKRIEVSNPRHDVYKLYTINFVVQAVTLPSSLRYRLVNKDGSDLIRTTQRPNFYLQEGDIIYGAYYNQPHDYNAKYVAGYIIGRALCYKNQKPDPMAVVGEFSRKDFRSGFHEHFHCK
jgi:hypothetical protein